MNDNENVPYVGYAYPSPEWVRATRSDFNDSLPLNIIIMKQPYTYLYAVLKHLR